MKSLIPMMVMFMGCGQLEAEYTAKREPAAVSDDGVTDDGVTDEEPAPDPTPEPTPYECIDEDRDGACTTSPSGEAVDCNDSPLDADSDGIIDGTLFNSRADDSVCDGIDQDCDGITDGYSPYVMMFVDADGDTFGSTELVSTCTDVGFSTMSSDCDDTREDVHPFAEDMPGDGIDSDCDDETVPVESTQTHSGKAKLTIGFEDPNKLELNVWLEDKDGNILDGSWNGPWASQAWSDTISTTFEITEDVASIRWSVTIGGGNLKTWLCVGNGDSATLYEGSTSTLELSPGFSGTEPTVYSAPRGAGCGLTAAITVS